MDDFFAQSAILILMFWWFIWRHKPDFGETDQDVCDEGKRFLEQIKGTFTIEQVAELPVATRESLIEQAGFDVETINKFINLAVNDPKIKEVTPPVRDLWRKGYRATRQSIRRTGDLDPFN